MAKTPDLHDWTEHPGMVGWFNPPMLLDIARQAIVSAVFGQYADRRLIQAALDPADEAELLRRTALTATIPRDANGAIWIDYVADLGDGFDSTYAIAYLLGRPKLEIEGAGTLPRGQLLVMGGDQVYPAATRKEYKQRMRQPYAYAFPDSAAPDAVYPPLVLIPGNHDWYDGLTLFLALFCTSREKKIGSWRAIQRRSYFAQELPDNWWLWAFDSQLGEDVDQPQADYFVTIARKMPEGAKIILSAPVPTWLYVEIKAKNPEEREKFYRGLDYVASNIVKMNCKNARICAVISGDVHHYSRYSADDGTQFITAGGGGAFLHPTHQLVPEITISWMRQAHKLSLNTGPGVDHKPAAKEACYPAIEESRRLLWGNLKFAAMNWQFSITLGVIYWLAAQLLIVGRDDVLGRPAAAFWQWAGNIAWAVVASPMFLVVALALVAALSVYADEKTVRSRLKLSVKHSIPHLILILALVSLLPPLNALAGVLPWGIPFFILFGLETILIGGFVGGIIWGLYLLIVCWRDGRHSNDAFSAMRLDSHRHFLRLRITDDELTIYPIALDKAPRRDDWQINPKGGTNQNEAIVVPKAPLRPRLCEQPIVIRAQ